MMGISTTLGHRLGIITTACLLSVALPSAASAQKVKDKGTASSAMPVLTSDVSVDIPTIDAIASSVDEDTLRAIFSGAVVDNAAALADLSATSITIPEITINATTSVDGEVQTATVTFSDIVLNDVTDGTASSVALSGMSIDAGEEGAAEFGAFAANNFDIAGLLGLYGLVDGGGQTALETIYTDLSFEGGTFESPEISCTMGAITAAEYKARPINYDLAEIMALAESIDSADEPSPEAIGTLMRFYADVFTAFETSPIQFDGFECDGLDDDGSAVHFAIAGMTMSGMSPGIYPQLSVDGLDITVEGDGTIQVGNFTLKEIDLSGPIATILAAPAAIDAAWLEANVRGLIPAFAGFSLADILVDVPDPEGSGARIVASVAAYDLTLGGYFNGVPTALSNSASNIVINLPEDSDDEQVRALIDLGLGTIDMGFAVDLAWNEAEDTIEVNEISVTGADLASAALSGTIVNATEALFSLDEDRTMMAAMAIAIRSLKLDITDSGLSDIILARVAADEGSDAETLRPVYAGLAEGTIIGMLAGAAEAQKVGSAIGSFVSGKARSLTIELTARQPAGLGMFDFMTAEDDPASLIGKVNINATAK